MTDNQHLYSTGTRRRKRKKDNRLRVTFPDGSTICYKDAVYTLLETLRRIGSARFNEINLTIGDLPLISQQTFPQKKGFYTKEICDGWYYINQSDVRTKYCQLLNISKTLNLRLKVEVGDFKSERNPRMDRLLRPKNRLVVTMPNGEVIDYDSYKDVFMDSVYNIGPRVISSKANFELSDNCPLLTTTNTNGQRKRVDEFLYLAIPGSAKDAKKVLDLIFKRLECHEAKAELVPLAKNNK